MEERELSQVAAYIVKEVLPRMQSFRDWVIALICETIFGVAKPEEIPSKLIEMADEAAKRHSTTMTDDDFRKRLKTALGDPEVFEPLCHRLDQHDRAVRRDTAERRLTVIRAALQKHFGLERPEQVAESLVQTIFGRRALDGREPSWPEKAETAIALLEQEMVQTIEGLLKPKRPKTLDLTPYARLLLTEGITPDDKEAVKNALGEREEIRKYLKE